MNKETMVKAMVDNRYPDAWEYLPSNLRRKRSEQHNHDWLISHLLYHVLKEKVCQMYQDYLDWIEENK